jgi:hypothetical protein
MIHAAAARRTGFHFTLPSARFMRTKGYAIVAGNRLLGSPERRIGRLSRPG